MNIKGIGTQGITSIYTSNAARKVGEVNKPSQNDTVEISDLGRVLNMYDVLDIKVDNSDRIAEIKEKIANGTYNVDAKLTAKSIMNSIKEGRKTNDK